MSQQWLLLQTKPREELRAQEHLQNQGCTTYCPQINVEKLIRGKRTTKLEPLFPGYLFVRNPNIDELGAQTYTSIRSTRGVSKIVRFGVEYTLLSNDLIETIEQQTESLNQLGLSSDEVITNLPRKGDKVVITQGPFKGLEAIYTQADGQMRSMLLITILHQQATVTIYNTEIAV